MGGICSTTPEQIQSNNRRASNPHRSQEVSTSSSDPTKPPAELIECIYNFTSLVSEMSIKGKRYLVSCIANEETRSITFCARGPSNDLHFCELSDSQLMARARLKNVKWKNFFSSIRTGFKECTLTGDASGGAVTINIQLEGATFAQKEQTFPVILAPAQRYCIHRLLITPLLDYYFECKSNPAADEVFRQKEQAVSGLRAKQAVTLKDIETLTKETEILKAKSITALAESKESKDKCDHIYAQVRRIKYPRSGVDYLYADGAGPPRYPLHTQYCRGHTPQVIPHNETAVGLISHTYRDAVFNPPKDNKTQAKVSLALKNLKDPHIKQMLEGAPDMAHEDILHCLDKIDDWDFDVFALQEHCKGGSLFMVSYCLFWKYGLVQHFNIDPDVLLSWCLAVESGYHDNTYHNSTHAADVTQILHYILYPGGMHNNIKISPEDAFASIISGSIHDFDHPGFNNNFHVRTNAYLATLYNDRSVLENHHCTSIFELMKNPKFNILQSLSVESRKDVRDTILEMVLSTDMGNHAKIFQTFKKRMQDEVEWAHKEDIRLALSIAIKMADISNCGRPKHLYLQWATKIADEFYQQGDVERKLHFTVSPFMDRLNHKTDFPKGQMSFMNYIVIPLFEAGAEFCPQLEWTVQKIQDNKEYWQRCEEGGA